MNLWNWSNASPQFSFDTSKSEAILVSDKIDCNAKMSEATGTKNITSSTSPYYKYISQMYNQSN